MAQPFSFFTTDTPLQDNFSLNWTTASLQPPDLYTAARMISHRQNQNLTSCTYQKNFKQILLPTIYTLVFLFGIPLNFTVIVQIWRMRPNLSSNKIYMLNLAVADFLYGLSLPILIYNYASNGQWPFKEFICKLVRFQSYCNLHGSIFFLTCISVQRYKGICYPFRYNNREYNREMALWTSVGVWLVVGILCMPTFHFAAIGIRQNQTVCYELCPPDQYLKYLPYGMSLTVLGFLLPFVAVMLCYCRMIYVLCKPASYEGVNEATGAKREKAGRMIIIVAAVFVISFLPFHVTKTMYLVLRMYPDAPCAIRNLFSIIYKSSRPFTSVNSIMDPILFHFTKEVYRHSTQQIRERISKISK